MRSTLNSFTGSFLGLGLAVAVAIGGISQSQAKQPPSNPAGAGAWDTKSQRTPSPNSQTFDTEQMALIGKINGYFNALDRLQGRFEQTDADKTVSKGKIFIKRPGRFRFEYSRPSRKIIVSDGRFLAVQDLDLRNEDTYELDNTPFRILLRKDVDLIRDAKIHELSEVNGAVTLTLSDKDPDAVGAITVSMKIDGDELALTGWTTTDAQGLKTVVTVSGLSRPEQLDDKLFVREKLYMRQLQQN